MSCFILCLSHSALSSHWLKHCSALVTSVSTVSLCRCNTPRNAASRQHFTFHISVYRIIMFSLWCFTHHIFSFPHPLSSRPLSLCCLNLQQSRGCCTAVQCAFAFYLSTDRPKQTRTANCIHLLWHHRLGCGQRMSLLKVRPLFCWSLWLSSEYWLIEDTV